MAIELLQEKVNSLALVNIQLVSELIGCIIQGFLRLLNCVFENAYKEFKKFGLQRFN